jgi:ribonuclease HII
VSSAVDPIGPGQGAAGGAGGGVGLHAVPQADAGVGLGIDGDSGAELGAQTGAEPAAARVAGVDGPARGPLAGPVCAAAVVLDPRRPIAGLRDSKRLSAAARERLHDEIVAQSLCWAVAWAGVDEIDRLNILQATLLAMRRAVLGLRLPPTLVLVDGRQVPALPVPARALVGGDDLEPAISAASILAKVRRDRICAELHARHPGYGFDVHKGYPTAAHLEALRRLGPCAEHRYSYAPVAEAARRRAG